MKCSVGLSESSPWDCFHGGVRENIGEVVCANFIMMWSELKVELMKLFNVLWVYIVQHLP